MKIQNVLNKLNSFCPECLEDSGKSNKLCLYCVQFRSGKGAKFIENEKDREKFKEGWKKLNKKGNLPDRPTAEQIMELWSFLYPITPPSIEKYTLIDAYPYRTPYKRKRFKFKSE